MKNPIKFINPEGLMKNPAFSQVVTTQGRGKTIYIGGQNAVNGQREIIGKGDITLQTDQVMNNLGVALKACNADFENLIKLNIHIVHGQNAYSAFEVSQKFLANISNPPIITVLFVSGLINDDFLIEINATAFVPD